MEQFIRRQNIEYYRRLLETVTDETDRQRILKLLAEEQKKQLEADAKRPATGR
jgi:hypothetical protein